MEDDRSSGDFVQSLERGLAVLRAFDHDHPSMTLADAARATGLTRATARRLLHTFVALGYVTSDGKRFELTPKVLDLGYAYVSSLQLSDIAQPFMEHLSGQVHESVSAAVLDGHEVVYVARVNTQRIMRVSLSIGSRLPALWTSMGRAILSGLDDAALASFVATAPLTPPTERSLASAPALVEEIRAVRSLGYALVDQELEEGVRSIAAPLRDRSGRVLAGMNVSTHAGRVTLKELRAEILPRLLAASSAINAQLTKR
jgi:IclR family transcriptional regulator, pca regulon regulatory protein